MKAIIGLWTLLVSTSALAQVSLWPTIPFSRGADLCQFSEAYGQTREQAMRQSVQLATQLMRSGAYGSEAFAILARLDEQVDKNRELAIRGNGLDVTLEASLHASVDTLYRQLTPRVKKIQFTHAEPLASAVTAYRLGHTRQQNPELLPLLNSFAYGTYSYAPGCRGDLLVTITVITQGGRSETFKAQNRPERVMGDIAARMFEAYQRTTFPTTLRIRQNTITLVGGLNGSVDRARSPEQAEWACESLDARLPSAQEYEAISLYGDWSGGVSLNDGVWALPEGKIYIAEFRQMPVREPWESNATEYLYYCIR